MNIVTRAKTVVAAPELPWTADVKRALAQRVIEYDRQIRQQVEDLMRLRNELAHTKTLLENALVERDDLRTMVGRVEKAAGLGVDKGHTCDADGETSTGEASCSRCGNRWGYAARPVGS